MVYSKIATIWNIWFQYTNGNRSRSVLSESDDSKWTAVADPGKGPGGLGPPPYFWTKLRPEGPSKIFFKTAPSPLSQGLNDRLPPAPPLIWRSGHWMRKKRAYPLSCETTSKIEMSTQDGIIFQGPKSISPRPKDKEKPNNHISVGKGAWSCVLTQHEQRTEINFLKVWNLQHLFSLPNKRNLLFERKTRAALIEKVKRRFA